MELWITFSIRFSTEPYHPTDHEPPTYYNVAVFTDEVEALRFANNTGSKAVRILPGQKLEEVALA